MIHGPSSFEGIPEVCINGQWRVGCRSNWDFSGSIIFCRQLRNSRNISKFESMSISECTSTLYLKLTIPYQYVYYKLIYINLIPHFTPKFL